MGVALLMTCEKRKKRPKPKTRIEKLLVKFFH